MSNTLKTVSFVRQTTISYLLVADALMKNDLFGDYNECYDFLDSVTQDELNQVGNWAIAQILNDIHTGIIFDVPNSFCQYLCKISKHKKLKKWFKQARLWRLQRSGR